MRLVRTCQRPPPTLERDPIFRPRSWLLRGHHPRSGVWCFFPLCTDHNTRIDAGEGALCVESAFIFDFHQLSIVYFFKSPALGRKSARSNFSKIYAIKFIQWLFESISVKRFKLLMGKLGYCQVAFFIKLKKCNIWQKSGKPTKWADNWNSKLKICRKNPKIQTLHKIIT